MTNLTLVVSLMLSTPQLMCGESDLGRCVRDSLFNEVVRLDRAADAAWAACDTQEKLAARQREVREKTIAALGGFPEKTPLNARVTGKVKKDGYVIEKILFESRPRHYVTANLFLPDDPKFKPPYPGVVSPCGHSLDGKLAPWYQRIGVTGAKQGLATLVYDPIDQGERRQHPKCKVSCGGHNNIGHRAALLGWNTAQFRVWDGIRACDYLASRPEVDASKLGVAGLSGGGTLSSYLNALDPRYSAAAPAGFLSTVRDACGDIGLGDAEQFMFGQLKFGFNHLGIVLMRAPSPIMLVTTHGDYFPFMGSQETFDRAKKVYSMLGSPEKVDLMDTAGPHHWYESTRNATMLWMRRWTAGDESAWPGDRAALRRMDFGFAYSPENSGLAFEPRKKATVTKTGRVMDIPGARSVYDVMRDELARLDEKRVPPTIESVRSVAGIRPVSSLSATPIVLDERRLADGRAVRLVLSRDDDMTPIPLAVFLPVAAKGEPVMLVSGDPAPGLADEVKKLISQGRPVAVAQLRGFGATAKGLYSFYGSKRADEEMAAMAISIGQNLASLRAEDAAIAARHFASMLGGGSVALVAHKEAAIPAAHAYFLERGLFSSFATISPPPSWHETVRSPTAASSFANTVFGALKAYDWTDLANRRPEDPAEKETREREELSWLCREWHAAPERIWPAHPSAAKYPGVPEAGTPRVTLEVDIDLSIPRWHGTGLFEAAGEPITVTLPEGAEKLGLRVRVGTTHCNITSHKKWSRAPVTTVEIPLKKRKTVFSTPFGGMVYVTVPYGKKGSVKVKIGPACPAARYVDGRDNLETWAESLKTCPAPMAEIESDVIALTVPREDALKAKDPQAVLDIWRKIMENDARLTGIPAKRQSPERMCFDVQLCCGYMHSGYPIMIPKHSAKYLLNPDTMLKGDQDEVWGFFHEMGHNHQNRDWTFSGSVEVTVNFFSLYNMELICGKKPRQTHKMRGERLKKKVEKWKADGRSFDEWKQDPFLALYFFMELQEKYGWDSFIKLFAEYRALPQSERPKTDADKRRQWCERYSRIVGKDLTEEFSFMLEKQETK